MLPRKQRLLNELLMRGGTYNHQLNQLVGIEVVGRPVVLGLRKIDGAMAPAWCLCWVGGRGGPLQKGVDFKVWIGQDKR